MKAVRPGARSRARADRGFRGGVEGRGRLFEDDHGRVHEQRARDGNPLSLPARQAGSPLAHLGVVSLGKGDDELVCVGGAGDGLDFPLRSVGAAIRDVGAHGVVEQDRVLQHDADLAAQGLLGQPADILPVHQDPAGGGDVEPLDQAHQRALAASARTHQGYRLPRVHVEI